MTHHPDEHLCSELLCCQCLRPYPLWYADSDIWNAVMRESDGTEPLQFLCPNCFLFRASHILPLARITGPGRPEEPMAEPTVVKLDVDTAQQLLESLTKADSEGELGTCDQHINFDGSCSVCQMIESLVVGIHDAREAAHD